MATKPKAKKGAAKKVAAAATPKKPASKVQPKSGKSAPAATPKKPTVPAPKSPSAPALPAKPAARAATQPKSSRAPTVTDKEASPPRKPSVQAPIKATDPEIESTDADALGEHDRFPRSAPPAPASSSEPVPFSPNAGVLTLSVQTSPGAAASGNTHPANILVIVTCGGNPVTELSQDHFTLMQHFEIVGQHAPFSNNITSFRNAGTGAYLLQTKPITGAPWRSGHHLAQLLVSSPNDQQGQAAIKFVIR